MNCPRCGTDTPGGAAFLADDAGHGNLALAHFFLHDFAKANDEARRAVTMNSNDMLQRNNLALYAMYAGDFANGATVAKGVINGNFDLGIAYVQAGGWAETPPEFEACLKRRGEATALFFDERPTIRYLASLPYWMGVAEEGMKVATAKDRFKTFLDLRQDAADPLVVDARTRLAR
jgi:hypothetical protein